MTSQAGRPDEEVMTTHELGELGRKSLRHQGIRGSDDASADMPAVGRVHRAHLGDDPCHDAAESPSRLPAEQRLRKTKVDRLRSSTADNVSVLDLPVGI